MGNSLFDRFPALRERLPWMSIGTLPTPTVELPPPEGFRGRLFVKRDDLTSPLYGGNKVRKLEPLLADAQRRGASTLVTVGGIGSHQALAVALHGRALGFRVDVSLALQPMSVEVRRNLCGLLTGDARIRYARSGVGALLNARLALRELRRSGAAPYYIPVGASNALGCAGYVAAALELASQVELGVLPEPDLLFVAAGTCGTAAGLLVGCRLAGLRTRVTAVRVAPRAFTNRLLLLWHARRVASLLARLDPSVPLIRLGWHDVDVVGGFEGAGYGATTPGAEAALAWAAPYVRLETTYTAKALAACLAWCRAGAERNRPSVVYWNTHNAAPVAAGAWLEDLPAPLGVLLPDA